MMKKTNNDQGRKTDTALVEGPDAAPAWTFLSNHAHVLLLLAREPELRMRDVAQRVGITERGVQRIVSELEETGYLIREKIGRRNQYYLLAKMPLRHPIEAHKTIGDLMALILTKQEITVLNRRAAEAEEQQTR